MRVIDYLNTRLNTFSDEEQIFKTGHILSLLSVMSACPFYDAKFLNFRKVVLLVYSIELTLESLYPANFVVSKVLLDFNLNLQSCIPVTDPRFSFYYYYYLSLFINTGK